MTRGATAIAMLLAGAAAQFGWKYAPIQAQADVWNASQSCLVLMLLYIVSSSSRSPEIWIVCALLAAWQALTAMCSIVWMVRPWHVEPGQGQCSAMLDLPLGLISLWVTAVVALSLDKK